MFIINPPENEMNRKIKLDLVQQNENPIHRMFGDIQQYTYIVGNGRKKKTQKL